MAGRTKTKAELEAELAAAYHGLEGCKAALAATILQNEEVLSMVARVHRIQQEGLVMLSLAFADVRDERDELRTGLRETSWRLRQTDKALTRALTRDYRRPVALDVECMHEYKAGDGRCLICGERPVEIVFRDAPGWK